MSEVSESFYLRSNDASKGIALLKRAGWKGVVFEPANNWVTIISQALLHQAVESFVTANQGILLHYMFSEGLAWEFSIYDKENLVFHYSCGWSPELSITDEKVNMDILQKLFLDPSKTPQVETLLYPSTVEVLQEEPPNHRFAELFGLAYYEWLSGEYIERIEECYTTIAYNDSTKSIVKPGCKRF